MISGMLRVIIGFVFACLAAGFTMVLFVYTPLELATELIGERLSEAALLSLAFAWKDTWTDRLPRTRNRGCRYYQDLADAVRATGADVIAVQPLRTSQVGRYAHKVNEHAVVRPYRAVLRLNGVAGGRVVQAIGQSRHLGGGLLVPRDVPAAGLAAAAPGGKP